MLFGGSGLVAFPETGEDAVLFEEGAAGGAFHFNHLGLLNVLPRRYRIKVEIFA
jgi:hypothetical protein